MFVSGLVVGFICAFAVCAVLVAIFSDPTDPRR